MALFSFDDRPTVNKDRVESNDPSKVGDEHLRVPVEL